MNLIKLLVNSIEGYYNKEQRTKGSAEQEEKEKSDGTNLETNNKEEEENTVNEDEKKIQQFDTVDMDLHDEEKELEQGVDKVNVNLSNEKHVQGDWATLMGRTRDAISQFPSYLFLKPLMFIWLISTYPFMQLFKGHSSDGYLGPNSSESGIDSAHIVASDSIDKTELLRREKLMENKVKSPSSSLKYIMPPPQRLYPLSRNPEKKRKRKTLVLDLDETLIHSLSRGTRRTFNNGGSFHSIEIRLNNISSLYQVYKRPYCDYFLWEISKWFDLQIFTASVREYADPIINWLETDILMRFTSSQEVPQKIFTRRYYRNDCTYRPGVGYIKDLSKFFPREEDLKNVIILDNSPISYALHEDNAVMIEGWINDQSDRDLLNLLPMLYSLSLCIDVRYILALRGGEKVFER